VVAAPAAAVAASDGQPDLHVNQLDGAGALEEGLKGLDGPVGAAVPVAGLVLDKKGGWGCQCHLAANFSNNCSKGLKALA
jgi:hypothetical protein